MEIRMITKAEADGIIATREPRGLFYLDTGKLNAHARQFYVVDRRSPIGYRLVTQPWDPFAQPQTEGERIRAEILSRRKETAV